MLFGQILRPVRTPHAAEIGIGQMQCPHQIVGQHPVLGRQRGRQPLEISEKSRRGLRTDRAQYSTRTRPVQQFRLGDGFAHGLVIAGPDFLRVFYPNMLLSHTASLGGGGSHLKSVAFQIRA